ncbi:hypothetical protein [Armatimonas rosea]|uniref:Uncharacterized protein n=1 Tax=Armatimonas rosea TaxID=685828 RepID=A0A7W9SNA0_ARMRO|nr:hypothetical protein [Armatimonas rosea]MBB6048988.1 hypothetical protein [Armatimonas rosea]
MKKILGWLMLVATLVFGYTRSLPPKVTPLPPAKTSVVYVGNLYIKDWQGRFYSEGLRKGARALYPSKAGRVGEKWGLLEVLATGSRSPLPPDAPRIPLERLYTSPPGPQLKDRIAALPAGERLLVVGLMTEGDHGAVIGDGWKFREVVLLGKDVPEGLLTSPSVRFRPGLIAATDIAATALGEPFGAGRPAVLLPGKSLNLERQRELWKQQGASGLVVVPWLLTPLLLLAAWKKWERLGRLVLAMPLAMLLTPLLGAPLYPFIGLELIVLFLATVALAVWKLTVKKIAFVIALVLWAGATLGVPLLEYNSFSYSLAEAARFYGIGNEGAGLLMGCALAAGFELPALLAVALAIGLPTLGANNGCFLAALAAVVLAAPTRKTRLGVAVLALLLVGGVVRWEASRAPQVRSHLGQAVTKGGGGLAELAVRKLAMSGYLLVRSPWMLLLISTGGLAWRKKKKNELLVALLALALNDSGVLAAATLLLPVVADQKTDTPPE